MSKPHYTVGNKFGRLTILARGHGYTVFCKCDCGKVTNPAANDLRRGTTSSCGCLQSERTSQSNATSKRTHGMVGTPTYGTWAAMKERCLNPKHHAAHNYSERGITIVERWLVFDNFYADMGDRPANTTLDRENNDRGYSKENCRWATKSEQGNNTRMNVPLTYAGRTQNMAQWAIELRIAPNTLSWRIAHGWSTERVLTQPVRAVAHRA